jgi:NAD(P)-dependent dehydrogenase (short-subunit alcohol dehydrogenase family)
MGTYLVIGGGTGIGKQVVQDLVSRGHRVIAASRNIEEAELPKEVEKQVYDALSDEPLQLPESLSGLVYCPGSIVLKPFDRFSLDQMRADWELNYLGAVKVLQQAIKPLKAAKGSVVLFSTVAVQTGMAFHSSISGAKGALEGLTRSLAAEYAPSIRFNAVAPSLTDTPLAAGLLNNDKKREANTNRHPLKKLGTPEDISKAVLYLLTDDSNWVTGQVLQVDGGMSAVRTL